MKYFVWKELEEAVEGMSRKDALDYLEDCIIDYSIDDDYNNEENRDTLFAFRAYIEDNFDE